MARFATAREPRSIQNYLIRHAEKRLAAKMGGRYRDVVVKCLTGSFGVVDDTKEDLKLQQAFRSKWLRYCSGQLITFRNISCYSQTAVGA